MGQLNSQSPRVSVIIPTYRRAHNIRECIDSVLAQTYQDFEIIVVDDGSTDSTRDVVAAYGERVRYIYQENRGPASARNTGIQAARGELVAFQDSDDLWLPEKLSLQVPLFDQDPEIGLVYCDMSYFRSHGLCDRPSSFKSHRPPMSGHVFREMFVQGCPMHTPTSIVRRRCLDEVGLFNEELRHFEDQDLWYRLAMRFKIDYVDALLVQCRVHDAYPKKNAVLLARAFRKRVLEASPWLSDALTKQELRRGYYQYAYRAALAHLATKEKALAQEALSECLAFDPAWLKAHVVWLGTYLPAVFLWAQRVLRGNDLVSRYQRE